MGGEVPTKQTLGEVSTYLGISRGTLWRIIREAFGGQYDSRKVNIRPFQEAGLLAVKEVIKKW